MTLANTNRGYPIARRQGTEDLFERLFDDFLPSRAEAAVAMDLYETDDAIILELGVPGLSKDRLDVSVEGRQLTVRAELPTPPEDESRRYWMRTLPRGAFTRSVRLPVGVDTENIDARVHTGMLTLRMPKAAEAKVRKVDIRDE
jgi:HSP20 family protein